MKSLVLPRISVYVGEEVHPIYLKLTSRGLKKVEDYPFETMKDLFIASACLGAKYDRYIESKANREIFDSTLFNAKYEVPMLYSLAYQKSKDLDLLTDGKKVITIAQGWANGGIHILEERLLNHPGRPLFNLVEFLWEEFKNEEGINTEVKLGLSGFTEERDFELTSEKAGKNFNIRDCADLLKIFEIELRKFIVDRLRNLTVSWWKQRVPNEIRLRVEKRKADREEPYPGMDQQDRPLYDYLDFTDLSIIITLKNNWEEAFKEVFVKPEIVQVKLGEISPIRNDVAHNRDISINDRELFVSNARQILRTIREYSQKEI